ncbi:MAG TPA: ATP-binding protein [Blastocatellia bacterium]|nr:ATP-binding protein [Blastocatellia bacterium]
MASPNQQQRATRESGNNRFKLILFFAALTFVLTLAVVYAWEALLMSPLYDYVQRHYPNNPEKAWKVAQRIEHFFISVVVDAIVVTLLLRLVDKQQRRLRESEERYRALFEHASDGIGVVRATDFLILDVNNMFAEILGYKPPALIGKHVDELFADKEPLSARALLEQLACEESDRHPEDLSLGDHKEVDFRTASGGLLPVSLSCSVLSMGEEKLLTLIIHDLTERKKLQREREAMQRQLFQSSKLASIGELSAGVAHEINNPLNGIINFAQLLKDDGVARNETERQMVDGIIEEGERIAVIVRNLLTFARQDPHMPTEVEIRQVIDNSIALFGHQFEKAGITLEIDLAEDVRPVLADASRLRQVVVNMMSNAFYALKARDVDPKVFRITARNRDTARKKNVEIAFFDNGIGIPQQNLDKIFDPFFTTRRDDGGTGLGLSLSFGIIRDYAGEIRVESEEGSHTRFVVTLPASDSEEVEYVQGLAGRRRAEHPLDDGGASQA